MPGTAGIENAGKIQLDRSEVDFRPEEIAAAQWNSMKPLSATPQDSMVSALGLSKVSTGDGFEIVGLSQEQSPSARSAGECQPEYVQSVKDVNGIPTAVNEMTDYGKWLREIAGDALSAPLPDKAPELDERQQKIVDNIVPQAQIIADSLMALSKGQLPDTQAMREAFKALQDPFNSRMDTETSKKLCDAINLKLKDLGLDWMRLATSEVSGEVWMGIRSGDKFTTRYEIRNKVGCPEMPADFRN